MQGAEPSPISSLERLQRQIDELRASVAAGDADCVAKVDRLRGDLQRMAVAERELQDARTWMELAHEAGGVATYRMDIQADRLWWSSSVSRLYGYEPAAGDPTVDLWLSRIHPDDREQVEQVARAAIDRGEPVNHQFRIVLPDGRMRWIYDRGRVAMDGQGRPAWLHGVNVDITAARDTQIALAESEERFRRTFENANVGVAHVSLDGQFLRMNRCLCEFLGRDEAELARLTFQDITHPDDLGTDLHLLGAVLAGERPSYTMEKRYIRADGEIVWADLSVSLLRTREGDPLHFISVVSDIQTRKRAQEQLQLVLAEGNHRVRNLLTVVSGIVRSSARSASTAKDLAEAINLRLEGIGASHDLLTGKTVAGGDLEQLIRRQLEIFTDCAIDRVELNGPRLHLTPAAIHAFGMVLHELATNACKYGALSGDAGRVVVSWRLDTAEGLLHFDWRELDGPPVSPPERQGFGTRTLLRLLSASLGGTASHDLPPEGALFSAAVPLGNVLSAQDSGMPA